jgi:hypothetical protein
VRHSERWDKAIAKAARAMFGAIKTPTVEGLVEDMALVPAPARKRRKPLA